MSLTGKNNYIKLFFVKYEAYRLMRLMRFFWQIIEFGLTQHRQSILVVPLPPQSLSASVAFLSFANAIFFYYFSVKKDIFFNPAIDY